LSISFIKSAVELAQFGDRKTFFTLKK